MVIIVGGEFKSLGEGGGGNKRIGEGQARVNCADVRPSFVVYSTLKPRLAV